MEDDIEGICLGCNDLIQPGAGTLHHMTISIPEQESFDAFIVVCWYCKEELDRGPALEPIINARIARAADDRSYYPRPRDNGDELAGG